MKQPPKIIPATFDAYAAAYDQKFNDNPLGKYQRLSVQAALRPYLHPATSFLDVGCGPGSDFEFYYQFGLKVDAIDISAEMVSFAQKKAGQLGLKTTIHCSALQHFQPEKQYDVILLNFGVINAIADLPDALEKLQKILAHNGVIFIVSMPPFHGFSFLADVARFRFRSAFRRVFAKKAVLANQFEIFYYCGKDFAQHFRVVKRIHLGALLPTPAQYANSVFARKMAGFLKKMDERLAIRMPDWIGGDHVCYVLERRLL